MEIRSIFGSPIYSAEAVSISELVAKAIAAGADLRSADLSYADLRSANLRSADLRSANLSYADLSYADLSYADLRSADLRSADLSSADLRSANLSYADLRSANLRSADLRSANLSSAKEIDPLAAAQTSIVPGGDLVVFKKLREGICKLLVPAEAKRSNATGRKCRAEFARVLELPEGVEVGSSKWDASFLYRSGEIVRAANWCDDRWNECSGGIHFFLTREEAEAY